MQFRSIDDLDGDLAWRRVLWWARRRMEVPDRLPFEIVERLHPGGPSLRKERTPQPLTIVMATKRSGTVRPFVRANSLDLLHYQALVDDLGAAIEGALLPASQVFAYRQNLEGADNQFQGSPRWRDFIRTVRELLQDDIEAFCLRADIAGYFLYVDRAELERRLLERGARPATTRDLTELLAHWEIMGARGLPQGLPASSPLGNFYLADLDDSISRAGFQHLRYMDDLWVFTDTFSEARRVQDLIEKVLYRYGLTLAGEKSRVERRSTALEKEHLPDEVIEARREVFREGVAIMAAEDYADEDALPDPAEVDAAAVLDLYQEIVVDLRRNVFPADFRSTLRESYRELGAARRAEVIPDVPELLNRFPDLTGDALKYVGYAAEADPEGAITVFNRILGDGRFQRELELLHVCRTALYLPRDESGELAERLGNLALDHDHPLVRARALLAWGAQSEDDDFSVTDRFWGNASATWRIYPVTSIQDKRLEERDDRYDRWSSAGRLLDSLAASLRAQRFSWKKI